jgi:hypothetical protein
MLRYNAEHKFLWSHGIDTAQDFAIQAAVDQWYRDTGAQIDKYKMLKIIIMKYGANASEINKILISKGEMFGKDRKPDIEPKYNGRKFDYTKKQPLRPWESPIDMW